MLDLEVIPERSLGNDQWEFVLGMPFIQTVNILKRQDRVIKCVQVWYSDQVPLLTDLVVNLSKDGIRLIFDPICQRLKIIEVYDMTKVRLKYCGVPFNSSSTAPTIEQIDQSFGATHPGVYNAEKQLFILNFRGLSFSFPIESRLEPRYAHGLGSLQFPNGASPTVSKMCVYSGNCLADTRSPTMPLTCYHGQCYVETLEVVRNSTRTELLKVTVITEGGGSTKLSEGRKRTFEVRLNFGDTSQDILCLLGSPNRIHYKNEDKMKIHSRETQRNLQTRMSDYFYNYFSLGMDILFDAKTNTAKKFVLHTNYPGHYNFHMYYRCEFRIPVYSGKPASRRETVQADDVDAMYIEPYTKWSQVSDFLQKKPCERPVVLNRSSSTNTTNPFGSTFCYGVQDMIFEVMQNGHIAAVTLYQSTVSPRLSSAKDVQ